LTLGIDERRSFWGAPEKGMKSPGGFIQNAFEWVLSEAWLRH
jgi:hypothetical protein